jgi:hypothetical protein
MTSRLDDQLTTFYADLARQPLTANLEDMTMNRIKKRATWRRVVAATGAGSLVIAAAVATAVVGMATHQGLATPGTATRPAGGAASQPGKGSASGGSTHVVLTGAVGGTMTVASTECWAGAPAATPSGGAPVPGQVPAGIQATGSISGSVYTLVISKDDWTAPGADPNAEASFGLAANKLGRYQYSGTAGVTSFTAGHSTTFDMVMTPVNGNGGTVRAAGEIVCP